MIVVGVDVHKYSLTAVAVDEVGRQVAALTVGSPASWPAGRWSDGFVADDLGGIELERTGVSCAKLRDCPRSGTAEQRARRPQASASIPDHCRVARVEL